MIKTERIFSLPSMYCLFARHAKIGYSMLSNISKTFGKY
jgi:hypothetical protein